jgi:hypothetical protein
VDGRSRRFQTRTRARGQIDLDVSLTPACGRSRSRSCRTSRLGFDAMEGQASLATFTSELRTLGLVADRLQQIALSHRPPHARLRTDVVPVGRRRTLQCRRVGSATDFASARSRPGAARGGQGVAAGPASTATQRVPPGTRPLSVQARFQGGSSLAPPSSQTAGPASSQGGSSAPVKRYSSGDPRTTDAQTWCEMRGIATDAAVFPSAVRELLRGLAPRRAASQVPANRSRHHQLDPRVSPTWWCRSRPAGSLRM